MLALLLPYSPSDWAIVPGRSLGHVRIGHNPASVFREFGPPTSEDAGMQKVWATWFGSEGGRLDIYSIRGEASDAPGTVDVRLVRATSVRFRLPGGLGTGASASRFKRAYPGGRMRERYPSAVGRVTIWDDVRRGLAWETTPAGTVLAVTVHPAGEPLPEGFSRSVRNALR